MNETLSARALNILHEWVQSESLRKHCYAVADSMKHFAQLRGEDADLWEAIGLLHDMDYESHPNLERSPTEGHPFVGVAMVARATVGAKKFAARSCRTRIIPAFSGIVSRENAVRGR